MKALVFTVFLLAMALVIVMGVSADPAPPEGMIDWAIRQKPNEVFFSLHVFGDRDEWQTLVFGDGAQVDLDFSDELQMSVTATHFYSYTHGGVVTYTAAMTPTGPGGIGSLISATVVIDDRQLVTSTAMLELEAQNFNYIEVGATWAGQLDECHELSWGDGSAVDLCGPSGGETKPHDYTYEVGGTVSYTVVFLGEELVITIDDRPLPVYMVYLPDVYRSFSLPTAMLELVAQDLNHVEVQAVWVGQPDECHALSWGDGSTVDLCGPSGGETKPHDYTYEVGGTVSYTVAFLGEELVITINDD